MREGVRRAGGSETNQELNNEVSQGKPPSADGKVLDPKPRYHKLNLWIITSLIWKGQQPHCPKLPRNFDALKVTLVQQWARFLSPQSPLLMQ